MIILASWTPAQRIKDLEALLKKAGQAYFNAGTFLKVDPTKFPAIQSLLPKKKSVEITDSIFDSLEDALRKLKPTSTVLRAKSPKGSPKQKTELPYAMWSLDKRHAHNAGEWIDKNEGPYVLSDKEDGQSLLLIYEPGKTVKIFTRAEPNVGHDVSYLAPHLDIPQKLNKELVVRGEAIISKANFTKHYAKTVKNARNMVSGLMNRKEPAKELQHVEFLAYTVYKPKVTISKGFELLKKLGFTTAPYKVVKSLTPATLEQIRAARREKSKYEADGLVVSRDVPYKHEDSNPTFMMAFKKKDAAGGATAKVKEIEWNLSRYGYWKPTIIIEPVALGGVTVTRATAHNAKLIKDHKLGPGSIIHIIRSGDVIPYVDEVLKGTKAQLPPAGQYEWNSTGVDLIHPKAHTMDDVKQKVLANFFSVLGAVGVKSATIGKMIDIGLDTPAKILKASPKKFLEMESTREGTATKIHKSIHQAWDEADLPLLMTASAKFGRNFGYDRLVKIVEAIPDVLTLSKPDLLKQLDRIGGFKTLASQFVDQLPAFKAFAKTLPITTQLDYEPEEVEQKSTKLSGMSFVLTGFRDDALEEIIEENGGEVSNRVSPKTTAVLAKDPNTMSGKAQHARDWKVPVISVAEFHKKFKV